MSIGHVVFCEHETGMQVYQLDTGREDRKEGTKTGRKEGKKEGRKEGSQDGRKEGRKKSSLVGQFVKMLLEEVPGQITTRWVVGHSLQHRPRVLVANHRAL